MAKKAIPTASEAEGQKVRSPMWGANTKLVVGIAIVAITGILLGQLEPILTPLVLAIILSYLLSPVIESLSEHTFLSWQASTNIIFILLLILLLSSLTASGVAIVNQFESLVVIIEEFLNNLPTMVEDFITNGFSITVPFFNYEFDVAEYVQNLNIDLLAISEQALSAVQPVLGQAGTILTKIATSAFSIISWGGFILVIAYLTLGEAKKGRNFLSKELEGLTYDIARMSRELSAIWDAFLRGQVLVFFMSSITMFILMSILGVRYALGLAILSGFARFIPYVGQFMSGIVTAMVSFFLAEGNYLGLDPVPYMLLVVILAVLHDQVYDSLVIPQLIGHVLGVHPALVLIVALIAARWIGFLGLLLAAPVLASFQLVASYIARKMLDHDPWPDPETVSPPLSQQIKEIISPVIPIAEKVWQSIKNLFNRIFKRKKQS